MEARTLGLFRRAALAVLAATLVLAITAIPAMAQDDEVPKFDIFAGYSWMDPGGNLAGVTLSEMPRGWGSTITYNVDKYWGLSFDFGGHYGENANVATIMVGPRVSFRNDSKITPFIHTLLGWHRLAPAGLGTDDGIGIIAGGGLDLNVHRSISLRLIEGDYVWAHHNFVPVLGTLNQGGARVRTGLVFLLGMEEPIPPSASCSAEPSEVMAGEPVRVTASAANFPKGRTLSYTWSATGGKVEGTDSAVTVDTNGLAPGSYTVTARVSDNRKANAECSASFSVKEPPKRPPVITCSANPATVQSGDASTITCSCTNPDNRSLGYSWSATGGRISGTGNRVQLDTAGAQAGPITVSTTCTDDRGLSDSTRTTVNVEVPPPAPQAERMNECAFTSRSQPVRVDNACKAILDDVALRLQRDADARAVLVGQADADERNAARSAKRRADNAKAYLAKEKGIDPSRIETRAGTDGGKRTEIWIVPPGATF